MRKTTGELCDLIVKRYGYPLPTYEQNSENEPT